MSEVKLNPCPFCGHDRVNVKLVLGAFRVRCPRCDAVGPLHDEDGKKWNSIAALDALRLQLAAEAADAVAKVTKEKDDEIATIQQAFDMRFGHIMESAQKHDAEIRALRAEVERLKARVPVVCRSCSGTGERHQCIDGRVDYTCRRCNGRGLRMEDER